ncbi:Receptor kinase-like protein Xa21 [Euphorbia peplus]|nr:Receptor kinase-like protein Xa21 [Euphorbia peplus]
MKGTIGYISPENGLGCQATTFSDVYSFGIILLEIFTGRRPTDGMLTDGLNLHKFVKSNLSGGVIQVLDPDLIAITSSQTMEDDDNEIREDNVNVDLDSDVIKCITSVLEIGLSCSEELPNNRMNMRDANRKLNVITEAFLRTRVQ